MVYYLLIGMNLMLGFYILSVEDPKPDGNDWKLILIGCVLWPATLLFVLGVAVYKLLKSKE